MTRRKKLWIAAVAATLLVAVALVALKPRQKGGDEAKPAAPPLEFTQAELTRVAPQPLAIVLEFPGTVQAVNQATVRSKLSAEVRRVLVREGEAVAAGQVLAEFDTQQLRALLAERQASYDAARAQLATTERNRAAQAQLVQQNFISKNAFDTADSNFQAQLAQAAAARAALEQTQLQMADAQVRAPIAGIVGKRAVQPGEKVGFDAPLFTVVDLARLEVQAQAAVSDVPQLAPGMAAEVRVEGLPGRQFAGRLERINPAAEAGTRTLNVYVSLPNEGSLIKAGMFAKVAVSIMPAAPLPSLPLAALRGEPGAYYVWVLAGDKLARRNVAVGRRDEQARRVELRSGVDPDEVVLAAKFDNLREGQAAMAVGNATPAAAAAPAAAQAAPAKL